jgi:hypothetical protein
MSGYAVRKDLSGWRCIDGPDGVIEGEYYMDVSDGFPPAPVPVQPTPTELIAALKVSVQQWLDTTAQASGYDSLASCASYISSSVTAWASDAKAAIAWRDAVWQACFTQMSAAQGATSPAIPTATALIAALPQPATFGWSAHAAGA